MKNLLILVTFTILFIGCKSDTVTNPPPANVSTHTIFAYATTFSPNSLNADVGDTIKFVWSEGTHTTTSTSVPTGAEIWDAPLTSANPIFIYVINTTGNYTYQCNFHVSVGMTGSFTATAN